MCCLVHPIQLSEFDSIFDNFFDLNGSTGAIATLCPSSAGWLIAFIIMSPLSIAMGIFPSNVAVMLAAQPSKIFLCIFTYI